MKYYKIEIKREDTDNQNRLTGCANGKEILNANSFFYRMRDGEIIKNAPLFDYFFLQSYEEKKYWEDYLMDVHDFIGEGSQILGWFVSDYLRLLLCNFNLPQHMFYPSKLLYKGKKVDYYIFQFAGGKITDELEKIIDFRNSIFIDMNERENSLINSLKEYAKEYYRIFKKEIVLKRLQLKKPFDFFPMETFLHDNIVSVRLKQAIEDAGITGFEFSELDYDVVVEE